MVKSKKVQVVLMVENEIYRYLRVMSMLESLPMSALVTVMVEEDMLENEKEIQQFKEYIFQSSKSK